uniref:Golgin subfamily A member 1 n=1 Tax=Zosterops lateralis melanops TaxID=1220523 RepID=A0A8D2QUV9_ZOSLA
MFAKLKKKIAEEAAVAPRPGGAARIPRSVSRESITSVGADSGDDFASDGSSSREDISSQLFRRNEQIRKLEVKLSDYADQIRNLQKIKEKLENALEKHQDSSMRKFQEQNEAHQASRAKMAEGMALALEKKDKEWMEKLGQVEKEKKMLQTQLQEMREQSLNLFQKRDEIDELEGFQQQEIAKVKHMLLKKEESLSRAEQELEARAQELTHARAELQEARSESSGLRKDLQDLQQQFLELQAHRDELMTAETNAENKITALELREQELQTVIQQLSVDLQNMTFEFAERDKLTEQLQEKVSSLENKLERNLSGDEHVQELIKEVITQLKSTDLFIVSHNLSITSGLQSEMSSRETVSVEIAKALEETRKQREELQQQTKWIRNSHLMCSTDTKQVSLFPDHEAALLQVHQLQLDIEASQSQAVEKEETARKEIDELKLQVQECLLESTRALNNEHFPSPENSVVEQNGEVAAADVIQLQKDNRELEQQVAEKNKMIKQLQQRMAELKKTLQKELKIRPDSEVLELRANSEVPNASVTVTNNSDLNDSREINFEYLKHVVLKFMSCRESEAFHLIKAVSVLLNFSQEEENMLKETLEYKMSWFGSKPSPKGSIRPSISSPRTLWP